MRLALLQINPTAGDLEGNSSLIVRAAGLARAQGADLMVTPELALMGYLPRDLLMNHGFVRRASEKLSHIAAELKDAPPVLVGVATPTSTGGASFNSAAMCDSFSLARRRGGTGLSQNALADLRCLR